MRGLRTAAACVLLMVFLVAAVNVARADVSPGDVIDKTNWEKVQGLLPDPVLELSLIHISEPTRPVGISRMPSSA